MAKAITEIALGAAAIAAPFVLPGLGVAISAALTNSLISAGASLALSGGLSGLAALEGNKGGIAVAVTSPIGPWTYVYGRQKVGGIKIFEESNNNTGGGGSTSNNKQLHRVYAIACHPSALGSWQLRIDGKQVLVTPNGAGYSSYSPTQITPSITSISRTSGLVTMTLSSGIANADGTTIFTKNVADNTFNGVWIITQPNPADNTTFTYVCGGPDTTSSGGICSTTYADYKDKIYVEWLDGTQTSTFSTLEAAGTSWLPTCIGAGHTLVYVQMGYDSGVFPSSIPNVSFIIDGKNDILDPRTGTRGFTKNAALCIADYMSLPVTKGGFGLTIGTDIPTAQLIAAANICDESVSLAGGGTIPRYTCNTYVQLSQARGSILQSLLSSCAGRLSYQGGTFSIFPGAWIAPTLQLTESDLTGPIKWMPRMSIRDTANGVKGTYVSPENAYQQGDIPPYVQDAAHGYSSDQYLIEDRNERIFKDVNCPCTDNSAEAQRLLKIELLRTRYQGRGTIRCSMRAYQAVALDVIQLSHARYGWVNKNLEILGSRFVLDKSNDVPTLAVELDIAETDPSIYDWSVTEQLTPQGYKEPTNSGTSIVSPPEGLTLYSGPGATVSGVTYPNTVSTGADGIKRNSMYVLWTPPNDTFVTSGGQIEVMFQSNGASTWTEVGKFHGEVNSCYINNVSDGLAYNVRIRSINIGGYTSDWVQAGPETLSSVTSSISASAIAGLSGVATSGDASMLSAGTIALARLPSALASLSSASTTGATVSAGASAQVGSGASVSVTGSGLAGQITLATGTGTLTPGAICTVTFPSAFTSAPNGVVACNGTAISGLTWTTSSTALTLTSTTGLTPSTTYTIAYSMN